MPRPQSGATKDRLVRVQARSVTGPRHRPPRAGAGWPCSPSPDRQGRDRPEVAPRPRQIDPSEQMLRLASAPRIRPPRAGSRTILAPMWFPPRRTVNRRPKRAHPHYPLNTLACKLFLALRWAPFGRRSALNRSPPILVKWQTFQVLRHRRWVGPLWTLIHTLHFCRVRALISALQHLPVDHRSAKVSQRPRGPPLSITTRPRR